MKVKCKHCGYEWNFKGKRSWCVCSKCGKGTKVRAATEYEKEYRKKYAEKARENNRKWYLKNREKLLEKQRGNPERLAYQKKYRKQNLEYLRKYDRERNKLPHRRKKDREKHKRRQRAWNNGQTASDREIWEQAEKLSMQLLRKEGFTDIEQTNFYFPFDYWGKLNGQFSAIQVTCCYKRHKNDITKRFLNFSKWQYFFLFITPDLKKYILKECPSNQKSMRAIASKKDIPKLKEIKHEPIYN